MVRTNLDKARPVPCLLCALPVSPGWLSWCHSVSVGPFCAAPPVHRHGHQVSWRPILWCRSKHTAIALGSSMYVFGGKDREKMCESDLWALDTVMMKWKKMDCAGAALPRWSSFAPAKLGV